MILSGQSKNLTVHIITYEHFFKWYFFLDFQGMEFLNFRIFSKVQARNIQFQFQVARLEIQDPGRIIILKGEKKNKKKVEKRLARGKQISEQLPRSRFFQCFEVYRPFSQLFITEKREGNFKTVEICSNIFLPFS